MSEASNVVDLFSANLRRRAEAEDKVEPDSGGPHDGGMPPDDPMAVRVALIEQAAKNTNDVLKEIRDDLKALRTDVSGLRVDMGEMKGKVANLPTAWTMVTTILGSTVAIAGLSFVVARFVIPALQ